MARRAGKKSNAAKAPVEPDSEDVIFDWNAIPPRHTPEQAFELSDESLRDGLQSPTVVSPSREQKQDLLDLMAKNRIHVANIGFPAAGERAFDDVVGLARYVARRKLKLELNCAGRTLEADLAPIAEAQQKAGIPIAAYTFIGSSPIRQWAEDWDLDFVARNSAAAIRFAVKEGLDVGYVTEDTTRTPPQTLDRLFRTAIDAGATRLVLCDTVGHATPGGVGALIAWVRGVVKTTGVDVKIEWHGHNDRGLALVNALWAIESGVDRVHGCGLGIGERVGNTAMDLLLLNLKLLGWIDWDLSALVPYVQKISEAVGMPIPRNYPLSGEDAFRTTTGVHAAAIIKAKKRGQDWLADRVYSGVPATEFGRKQEVGLGPNSGMSNVRHWCEMNGLQAEDALCRAILKKAKAGSQMLTDAEVEGVLAHHGIVRQGTGFGPAAKSGGRAAGGKGRERSRAARA